MLRAPKWCKEREGTRRVLTPKRDLREMGLEQTSSWAVACVCAIFVVLSLLVEAGINYLGRVSFPLPVCVKLYRNFMVFCLQLMKQTKLDCWVGGGIADFPLFGGSG
jgi:hypothetical protein